jgi:hypothetical protein
MRLLATCTPRCCAPVAAVLGLCLAAPAAAQQVTISGTGSFLTAPSFPTGFTTGPFTFSTTLPQSPAPVGAAGDVFTLFGSTPVTFTQGITAITAGGGFSAYTAAAGGGIRLSLPGLTYFWTSGAAVFTGPVSAPTFLPGTYVPTGNRGDPLGNQAPLSAITSFTITATPTTVPEPSTVALLGAGLVMVGMVYGRRRS